MIINLDTRLGRFHLRPYQDGDGPEIRSLFREVFFHEKDPDVWEWEFLKNPYGTQILLCEHESGELVAQCAAIPALLYYQGDIVPTAQLVDCMSKKAYRALLATNKQGLFVHTTQAFFDTYTGENKDIFLYGFPGVRHYRLGALLLGYRKTVPYVNVQLTHPFPRHNFGKHLIRFTPESLIEKESAIAELHQSDLAAHKLCLFKEAKYLQWRYGDAPRSYTIIGLASPFGKLLALAFLQQYEGGYRLLDFFGYAHINRLIGQFIAETGIPVTLWLQERHFSLFSHLKPMEDNIGAIPVARSFHESLNWDWANEHFFYTMGDCDLF